MQLVGQLLMQFNNISFFFCEQLVFILAAQKQQKGKLLNDGERVADTTCPKRFPDFIDLAF